MNRCDIKGLIILTLSILLLTACSPESIELQADESRLIENNSSFGQSFTAEYNGLNEVAILLAPGGISEEGTLSFHLRSSSQETEDIENNQLLISEINEKGYYEFTFPAQHDSQLKDYFVLIEVVDGGQVQIFTAKAESYLDGSLYEDQSPQDAQLGFVLSYDKNLLLLGLLEQATYWARVLVIGCLLFIVPGWALFKLFWRGWENIDYISKFGLSGGLSLGVYPLLLLWTRLIGVNLGPIYAWFPLISGLLILTWLNREVFYKYFKRVKNNEVVFNIKIDQINGNFLADIAFVVIISLIIISRFWIIRMVDIPLFGDSYQHTMITQLILDHGGLFDSWEPYADLVTFTYHFGFHSAAAVYQWIDGVSAEVAVLWTGQLINILAIVGLYPLAIKISKNHWAGVVAVLVAGLLSPMPSTFVNWGRYTQLAGQAILPAAIWTTWLYLEKQFSISRHLMPEKFNNKALPVDIGQLIIVWLLIGGLALTHYRVLILFLLFFPSYIIFTIGRVKISGVIAQIARIGIGGAILFLPWLFRVYGGKIFRMFSAIVTTKPSALPASVTINDRFTNFENYLPTLIWLLLIICLVWGLWKRNKDLAIFACWWLFIIFASNPIWFKLPGNGMITNFAVLIAFYIPASIVLGSAIEWIWIDRQYSQISEIHHGKYNIYKSLLPGGLLLIICALGLWGLTIRLKDLDRPKYALVTRPDLRAMSWIDENLPANANFLVNSFFAFYNSVVVGSDGGWWMPLLTGRRTTLPPLTYGFEEGIDSATVASANTLARDILEKGVNHPDIISTLEQRDIEYIYIGQRQGTVNYSGTKYLDPQLLSTDPNFEVIYHQDRVWIFQVVR